MAVTDWPDAEPAPHDLKATIQLVEHLRFVGEIGPMMLIAVVRKLVTAVENHLHLARMVVDGPTGREECRPQPFVVQEVQDSRHADLRAIGPGSEWLAKYAFRGSLASHSDCASGQRLGRISDPDV